MNKRILFIAITTIIPLSSNLNCMFKKKYVTVNGKKIKKNTVVPFPLNELPIRKVSKQHKLKRYFIRKMKQEEKSVELENKVRNYKNIKKMTLTRAFQEEQYNSGKYRPELYDELFIPQPLTTEERLYNFCKIL